MNKGKRTREIVLSLINTEGFAKSQQLNFAIAMVAVEAIAYQMGVVQLAIDEGLELTPPANVQMSSLQSKKDELIKMWVANAPF